MIGGHSPNVDVSELCNHVASAICLDTIFEHFPYWQCQLHCLTLKFSCDKDHLSSLQWKGELQANTYNLHTC